MAVIPHLDTTVVKDELDTRPTQPLLTSPPPCTDTETLSPMFAPEIEQEATVDVKDVQDATSPSLDRRMRAYVSTVVASTRERMPFDQEHAVALFKATMHLLRHPRTLFITAYILLFIVQQAWNVASFAVQPFCVLPAISSTRLCVPSPAGNSVPYQTEGGLSFETLVNMSQTSMNMIDTTKGQASVMSVNLQRAGMAVLDFALLVEHSDLDSKEAMGRILNKIYLELEDSADCLVDIDHTAVGSLDTSQAIFETAGKRIRASQRALSSPVTKTLAFFTGQNQVERELLLEWENASAALERLWRYVLEKSKACKDHFRTLDYHHNTLHELILREKNISQAEKERILANVWTFFGMVFNADEYRLQSIDDRLEVLKDASEYRILAIAYTNVAQDHYKGMVAAISDLRQRVAGSELLGRRIAIDTQLRSLEIGVARIQAHWTHTGTSVQAVPDLRPWLAEV